MLISEIFELIANPLYSFERLDVVLGLMVMSSAGTMKGVEYRIKVTGN